MLCPQRVVGILGFITAASLTIASLTIRRLHALGARRKRQVAPPHRPGRVCYTHGGSMRAEVLFVGQTALCLWVVCCHRGGACCWYCSSVILRSCLHVLLLTWCVHACMNCFNSFLVNESACGRRRKRDICSVSFSGLHVLCTFGLTLTCTACWLVLTPFATSCEFYWSSLGFVWLFHFELVELFFLLLFVATYQSFC